MQKRYISESKVEVIMSLRRSIAIASAAVMVAGLAVSPTLGLSSSHRAVAPITLPGSEGLRSYTPAGVDTRLAQKFSASELAGDSAFRFTPAGVDRNASRAMTIVVRSRAPATAEAMAVRAAIQSASAGTASMKITPTSYSLGAARGLQSFTLPAPRAKAGAAPIIESVGNGKSFTFEDTARPSRFSTRIALDKLEEISATPRPIEREREYSVDLGGSYTISKSVDVTAGVRYKSDNERAPALTDDRKDSQAVYVGTLIRF